MVCNIGAVTIFVGCIRKHLCLSLAFNKVARFKISRNSKGKTCAWVSFVIKFRLKKKNENFTRKQLYRSLSCKRIISIIRLLIHLHFYCNAHEKSKLSTLLIWYALTYNCNCLYSDNIIWDKVLKNGPCKICGRQPLKNFTCSILEYYVPYLLAEVVSSIKWSNVVHFCKGRQENQKNLFLRTLI